MSLRLKQLRTKAGLAQKQLSSKLGVAQNTLSHWEQGRYDIDNESLLRLSSLFNVSVDYLLGKSRTG